MARRAGVARMRCARAGLVSHGGIMHACCCACWAGAPWVMNIMHGCVPHACAGGGRCACTCTTRARCLLGWCPMGYKYHAWVCATCVHACTHTCTCGGAPAPTHTQRGRERLLGWCLMGCGSCMHMHRMYMHARNIHMCMACSHMHMCNSHTCTCVTHLKTTQHVGAACMST